MSKLISAIDVGTTKICTAIAEIDDKGAPRVVGVGITPSYGLHKGLVISINATKESIRESVKRAEYTSGHKVESAYVGVTGRHIISLNQHGAITIRRNDKAVGPDDLKRVLHSAQSLQISGDRKLLHVIPRRYTVDSQTEVKNPVGMQGSKLDVEAHVITAAINSIQNLVKCVRGVGVDIEGLVLEPLASSEAILTEEEKQAGVILADIGGGTTDVAVFKDGSIWHTAIISVAGYQLTRDIAVGLGLPFDVAEEMKKKYGKVTPIYESRMRNADDVIGDGYKVSYHELCTILRARVEEIIRLILLELPNSEYKTLVPAGLVLTGGSSNLADIDVLGREILRLPVRVGVPTQVPGISEVLYNPAYATSVGLLLWGIRHQDTSNWRSRRFGVLWQRFVPELMTYLRRWLPAKKPLTNM